ncbi:MAG: DUF1156 domain-containing protein [Planctomycetes bacterium]|nr:DUF1156 domain-containing protein [Planctomycetota bacterium]
MTIEYPIRSPRKLIEVALPLDAINKAAVREKSIRHGHPSTLHLWWARRPLAAARAVIFAQMVNDPGFQQGQGFRYGMNKKDAAKERERLFAIITELVQWENTTNVEVLERARAEIRRSWREVCELNKDHPRAQDIFDPEKLPAFHDPFAGGGALPLEAQRLGLEAYASDLNPVAVTINKAMIEIPPKFTGRRPVGPDAEGTNQGRVVPRTWPGASGLAEDVGRYGAWMRTEAQQRIGHLYPTVRITADMARVRPDLIPYVGEELIVIAWLWARTVRSPNPAFAAVEVPLASTFMLSNKAGKEAYVQPVVEGQSYRFTVRMGTPPKEAENGTKLGRGANFRCLLTGTPIEPAAIKRDGLEGRMGQRLMAVVAEGHRGRVYLDPLDAHQSIAKQAKPDWRPETELPNDPRNFWTINYGLTKYGDLFTQRQLVALTTFSDLVGEAIERCRRDAIAAGLVDDGMGLDVGGTGALAYAQAVGVYLALGISRFADRCNSLCTWDSGPTGTKSSTGGSSRTASLRNLFARQAIPMAWDFGEGNPFSDSGGGINSALDWIVPAVRALMGGVPGFAMAGDAQSQKISALKVVSTDPPYYDNIGYADLSDFFYVWIRKTLKPQLPSLYATMAVPKAEELVANPYRHGGKDQAEAFFLTGMKQALHNLATLAHPGFPVTIYYAFKQAETTGDEGTTSTGWVTFLQAVLAAGFALSGTWPMRTELGNRMIGSGTNALASSIILVCRTRAADARAISRREFLRELNAALPEALDAMTRGGEHSPVAPVDLSQAIIGPGMAIFSQYSAVLEADGTPMSVKTALQLINRFLAEDDFDHDTQFCLHWFDQHGWTAGKFGVADVLARGKGTSVEGVKAAGVIESGHGSVRLLKWSEYPEDWDPATDRRLPVWEALHHVIRVFKTSGESAAGKIMGAMIDKAEPTRQLAYRLYTLCERSGRADDARAYNDLITSWAPIESAAQTKRDADVPKQGSIFDQHHT